METLSDTELNANIGLYSQLDAIRAKKFVSDELLEKNIFASGATPILQETFPEWKILLMELKKGLEGKKQIIEFIIGLKRVEVFPLLLYLAVTGIAILTSNPSAWQVQTIVTIAVFIYLAGVRLATYFLVSQPVQKIIDQVGTTIPDIDQKLVQVINGLIKRVNDHLLTQEKSPNSFKHYLDHPDYPGLYYHGRKAFLGPRQIQSMPFPLHSVLSKSSGTVDVILGRMDEKLISGLGKVPQETTIQLVTLTTISHQTSFSFAVTSLYKAHPNLKLRQLTPTKEVKGVSVITADGIWVYDLAANWNETRYIKVKDVKKCREIDSDFKRLWSEGKLTKIKT